MSKTIRKTSYLLCLCYFLFIQATCEDEIHIGPAPSDFTKEMRTELGNLLDTALMTSPNFTILPNIAPYDSVYWFVQTLYDQANSLQRTDRSSSVVDRWSQDQTWSIRILEDDTQQNAFSLPGGHLYLTTGLLKGINQSYELYYLLSFEASLMNDRHVLNRLLTEYGAVSLSNLINQHVFENEVNAADVAAQMGLLDYDIEKIVATDETVLNQICETSIFDREGIVSIISQLPDAAWLAVKSFGGRASVLSEIVVQHPERCGRLRLTGQYRKQVLDRLP